MIKLSPTRLIISVMASLTCTAFSGACAADGPPNPSLAAGLKPWQMRPNGVGMMPLAGGLSSTDLTTFRMYYPAGLKVDSSPHYHFGTEHVIVLKGTIHLGFGSCLEPEKAVAYGPGSFFAIPAGTPHFEWFDGEVLAQVTAVGPMTTVKVPGDCAPVAKR